jgi:transcriptional regulator with XRE-family HTH domain
MALSYLSDVERGQKDISSEILNAIAHGLGIRPSEILEQTAQVMSDWEQQEESGEKINSCALLAELT